MGVCIVEVVIQAGQRPTAFEDTDLLQPSIMFQHVELVAYVCKKCIQCRSQVSVIIWDFW